MRGERISEKQVLAFDFDGTLCDGLNECVLVTWNGYHGFDLGAFSDDGLRDIPASFVARFAHLRNFSKHLGHFAVSLLTQELIENQEQFDRAYKTIEEERIYDFVVKVTHYRHAARQNFRDRWLAYHAFYPGVKSYLQSREEPLYVVTAKDADSVQAIFMANDVDIPFPRIYGEQRAKLEALDLIAVNEGITKEQLRFFDDNVFNAIEAKQAGYSAHWAGWGYSAPVHFDLASSAGMRPVQLDEFITGDYDNDHSVCALHDSRD